MTLIDPSHQHGPDLRPIDGGTSSSTLSRGGGGLSRSLCWGSSRSLSRGFSWRSGGGLSREHLRSACVAFNDNNRERESQDRRRLTGAAAGASAGGVAGAAGAAGCACCGAAGVTLMPFSPPTEVLPSVPLVMPRLPPRFCVWPSAPTVIPAFSLNCSLSLVALASPALASP